MEIIIVDMLKCKKVPKTGIKINILPSWKYFPQLDKTQNRIIQTDIINLDTESTFVGNVYIILSFDDWAMRGHTLCTDLPVILQLMTGLLPWRRRRRKIQHIYFFDQSMKESQQRKQEEKMERNKEQRTTREKKTRQTLKRVDIRGWCGEAFLEFMYLCSEDSERGSALILRKLRRRRSHGREEEVEDEEEEERIRFRVINDDGEG